MPSRRRFALILSAACAALPAVRADAVDASAPAILQMYEATYGNMERRAGDIFMAGYGAIWTPPPGRADSGNQSVGYDVYDRFDLGKAGSSTLYGTELGLKTLVGELHKVNMNVYTDMVWNHDGFRTKDTAGFAAAGGYPGFVLSTGGDTWGDFHNYNDSGDLQGRLAGLNDIAQEKNHQYVRNPVPGFSNNLPAGTTANIPTEANRRFYPNQQGPSIGGINDPATGGSNITYYQWDTANPSTGDPVSENATGYLMRHTRWMVEEIGVDGFRLDATKHMPTWVFNYFDQAVFRANQRMHLDGSTRHVFSFGEAFTGDKALTQQYIRKDISNLNTVGGNRDALDFPMHFALGAELSSVGSNNDWRDVVNASQDTQDDGLGNNGSQGVTFDGSHDKGGAYLSNVAQAYLLMRPGNSVVYFNAKEFGNGRAFPNDGRGDALGGVHGNVITTLVNIRNSHGRGNYAERWLDKETLVYERVNALVAGYSNRIDNGHDTRTVNTGFAAGSKLIELTGNATNSSVDPNNSIHDMVTVAANGQITINVPRNKNINGVQHNRGYVIYGPATPRGTLNLTNVSHTIAGETPSAANNGTQRLTGFDVVKANSFEVRLQTIPVVLPDSSTDLEAGGDNALVRFDGGLNVNGNGGVDVVNPSDVSYGFENFLTEKNPLYTGGNGLYRQTIDTTQLADGFHYITVRAYRHRPAAGTPLYTDFRKVIYVDRNGRPVSTLNAILPINGSPDDRDVFVDAADNTVSGVSVLHNAGAGLTNDQIADMADGVQSLAGAYERDKFKYSLMNWKNGNNAITIVTFEPSYDPALGYAGGGVSIERHHGIWFTTGAGAGLGDMDANNSLSSLDVSQFYTAVRSSNTIFNPGGDLNADGLVDDVDSVQYLPWLTFKNATSSINSATLERLNRALETDGTMEVVGGTLSIGGQSVSGVPISFNNSFNITANKSVNKTGAQTLNINATQSHGANASLTTSQGTTNMNTSGGTNLAVTTTGAGSVTNFSVTQRLRALSVTSGGVANLTANGGDDVNGGKVLYTRSLTAISGKVDLTNNNMAVDYTGSSTMGTLVGTTYTGVLGALQAGRGNGTWNGTTGVTASAATTAAFTGLAAAEASQVLGITGTQTAIWQGTTVDATTVLVKYTIEGDADLNGLIDADDYFRIDSNYGKTALQGTFTGDFDYSGGIDGDDYFIIDSNFLAQHPQMAVAALGAGAGAVSAVPEPSAAAVLTAPGALALLRRRRRAGSNVLSSDSR